MPLADPAHQPRATGGVLLIDGALLPFSRWHSQRDMQQGGGLVGHVGCTHLLLCSHRHPYRGCVGPCECPALPVTLSSLWKRSSRCPTELEPCESGALSITMYFLWKKEILLDSLNLDHVRDLSFLPDCTQNKRVAQLAQRSLPLHELPVNGEHM